MDKDKIVYYKEPLFWSVLYILVVGGFLIGREIINSKVLPAPGYKVECIVDPAHPSLFYNYVFIRLDKSYSEYMYGREKDARVASQEDFKRK